MPELGMTFQVQHEKTKIFGCQNPFRQGGGRKGLPRSFLNRFTQVRFTVAIKTGGGKAGNHEMAVTWLSRASL